MPSRVVSSELPIEAPALAAALVRAPSALSPAAWIGSVTAPTPKALPTAPTPFDILSPWRRNLGTADPMPSRVVSSELPIEAPALAAALVRLPSAESPAAWTGLVTTPTPKALPTAPTPFEILSPWRRNLGPGGGGGGGEPEEPPVDPVEPPLMLVIRLAVLSSASSVP